MSARVPAHGLRLLPDRPRGATLGRRGGRDAGEHGVPAEGGQALPGQTEEEEEDLGQLHIYHKG